jgi:hypothetical protein
MSFSYLSQNGYVTVSKNCVNDSNIGYETDFSVNGEVDKWTTFDGIHTYGCWNNFLFGTLYGDYALIGREEVFRPVAAEDFYQVKIVMKLSIAERFPGQANPTKGRILWRTISSPNWGTDKQYDFTINPDGKWHTYILNMAEIQWWQGDVNDLRFYPIAEQGRDGDEFYIRSIEILSPDKFVCRNVSCDYYTNYERNCPGIGTRGSCTSLTPGRLVIGGSIFDFASDRMYNIEEDANVLLVNINGYGFEEVELEPAQNLTGRELANIIAANISKTDIGGYAECEVDYTDLAEFKINSGTYASDSTVEVGDTPLARYLRFFNDAGEDISTKLTGENPASGFVPLSSFRLKTHQIHALVDNNEDTDFYYNPFEYNIEGGRADWLNVGSGQPAKDIRGTETEQSGQMSRSYKKIANVDKTIIDINHPFNASGRISKIYAAVTLDGITDSSYNARGIGDNLRKDLNLSGAKIMFFRPLKSGGLRVLPYEIDINDRDYDSGAIYAGVQEYVALDCDVFVNKGDLIGVYNANVYKGLSITGNEVDALYYQVAGKASGILDLDYAPRGEGQAGLLFYARSDVRQKRLQIEIDLGNRVNVENVNFDMETIDGVLDYNVARCLDINWEVDLFGHDHTTGYIQRYRPLVKHYYNHPNIYYGKECLSDGITIVPDGKAGTGFSVQRDNYYYSHEAAFGKQDGGYGVKVLGPTYFHVNGDEEWLGVYLHAGNNGPFAVNDFAEDPMAFTLKFPFEKEKKLYKSKIFFKEKYNFRSFGQSFYRGVNYTAGNADDDRFELIPERTDGTDTPWTKIILDGLEYYPEDTYGWADLDLYLAKNPSVGKMIKRVTGVQILEYDTDMAYWDELGGLVYQGSFEILNNDQYLQAISVDWQTITFEWPVQEAKGYRLYCDFHNSTKICEFEVYCLVENLGSTLAGSINVAHSEYGDFWWQADNTETSDGSVSSFIGDTPQHLVISLTPITEMHLKDIGIEVSIDDVYVGDKGCQDQLLLDSSGRGRENSAKKLEFENVYGRDYDLYIDIAHSELEGKTGMSYFSMLNDDESISNPEVGPDSFYKKQTNFKLLNYNTNVAINCPVYALKNLVDGAQAWYSNDGGDVWKYWGELEGNAEIGFSNLPDATVTTLNIPVLIKSKWWKIGFLDPRLSTNVREMRIYFEDQEIPGVKFYHNKGQSALVGGNTDDAPHLDNDIVDGSYYVLTGDQYIGIELPSVQKIDRIVLFHDRLDEFEDSHNLNGIDSATALCIQPDGVQLQTDNIVDYSYYEHSTQIGNGIYCDRSSTFVDYSFTEDFSTCQDTLQDFTGADGDPPDPSFWTDVVQASIENNTLKVTNSGIIGNVTTSGTFYGDFDVTVDYNIPDALDEGGWRVSLRADSTDNIKWIRIGRLFYLSGNTHRMWADGQTVSGYTTLGSTLNEINTGGFRLKRENNVTTLYYYNNGWIELTSSEILVQDGVTFSLECEYTPIATQVTTVYFDNFSIDNSAYDWGYNNAYNSTFECVDYTAVSGIGHWVQEFSMRLDQSSDIGSFKYPKIFDVNNKPLDKNYSFIFDFKFQLDEIYDDDDTPYDGGSAYVAIGLLDRHVRRNTAYNPWQDGVAGVQLAVGRSNFGLIIISEYSEMENVYGGTMQRGTPLFGRLTGDGAGNYTAQVWTDGWDGSNIICNLSKYTNLTWWSGKVGVGNGWTQFSHSGDYDVRAEGWVAAFDFSCEKTNSNINVGQSSVRFEALSDQHILVDYDNSPICNLDKDLFHIDENRFCFDFFIKFNSLPTTPGEEIVIAKCWDDTYSIGTGTKPNCSWAYTIHFDGANYYWRFYIVSNSVSSYMLNYVFKPDLHRWYHMFLSRGAYYDYRILFLRNGHMVYRSNSNPPPVVDKTDNDVIIGENLDGWLDQFRISNDPGVIGGSRTDSYGADYRDVTKSYPTQRYERRYTFSIWVSVDNYQYGVYDDVDCMFDNTYSSHEPFSSFSSQYYTYFAVDLGQRHDIEIIRSFPIDTSYDFSNSKNVLYSNVNTTDPFEAFDTSADTADPSTDFSGQNYSYPESFYKIDSGNSTSYILDDLFYQRAASGDTASAQSKFFFSKDFSFTIDYFLPTRVESATWGIQLYIRDANRSNYAFIFERTFIGSTHYIRTTRNKNGTWDTPLQIIDDLMSGTLKVEREQDLFKFYVKRPSRSTFDYLGFIEADTGWNEETYIEIRTVSRDPNRPTIECYWDNFEVSVADFIWSTVNDARWAKVKMLSGTGVTEKIRYLGIYPDVSTQRTVEGKYNTYWEELGTAITSYAGDENVALGATVSGSSFVGNMLPENLTNGNISNDLSEAWGGEPGTPAWVTVHLPEITPIYRIQIFHGKDDSDSYQMVKDYQVQVSTDNENFTTIFNITNNTGFERTHDLSGPVDAKYVRIYITDYDSREQYVYTGADTATGYDFWNGPNIREIRVYKYFGFSIINSQETPIIAIDLQQQYFIYDHILFGPDAEEDEINWDNDSSNFAWSQSNLTDPRKVSFSDWGKEPNYERWVVIKRNTATHYPTVPTLTYPETDMPDYLKYAVIRATVNEDLVKVNPVEHPWMWRSNFSELSYDYSKITASTVRSLRIDYPASTVGEHIRFIEGDQLGVDGRCSWRDGLGFDIYIDDIDNLDLDYGYIYFGGWDNTRNRNEVIYKWNFSTISGVLQSGWSYPTLTFSYADDIEYTEAQIDEWDPRRLYTMVLGKIGMVFRGKGNPLQINIDGFYIYRNRFMHSLGYDKGLYLHDHDFLKAPIGDFDLHAGAIEFFIRPDWNQYGLDIYNDYKFRALFHFTNTANDIFGACVSRDGFEVYYGNLSNNFRSYVFPNLEIEIDAVYHMAFVFSNDGTAIGSDGSTIRLYVNNILIGKSFETWDVADDKHYSFVFGGQSLLLQKISEPDQRSSSVDGVVGRLKIHNYCKTDYTDSISLSPEADKAYLEPPSTFVEISKDNLTFYKVGDAELPFVFEKVPAGGKVPIYVRTNIPKFLTGKEDRTAGIIASWDIGV